jgi:hypothetical protein
MIERGEGASLAVETLGELMGGYFDGDDAIEAGVATLPHFSHTTRAEGPEDLVGAEFVVRGKYFERFSPVCLIKNLDCARMTAYP